MAELSIKIGADVKKLKSDLNKAEKELENFSDSTEKSSESLDGMNETTESASKGTKSLSSELTSYTLTVASVAAVSKFLLTIFTQLEEDTGFLREAITGLSKEQIRAAEAQRQLNDAIAESVGGAQAEIFALESLISIARDETRSKEERENAINNINTQYPELLGNLDLERIRTNDVDVAVQSLTESIIRQAKTKALTDQLSKAYADFNKTLTTSGSSAATFSDKLAAGFGTMVNNIGTFKSASEVLDDYNKEVERLGELTNAADFFALEDQIESIEKQIKALISEENFNIKVPPPNLKALEKERSRLIKEAERFKKISDGITNDIESSKLYEDATQNLYDANEIAKELGSTAKDLSSLGGIDFDPQQGIGATVKELEKVEELIKNISKAFPDIDISKLGAFNSEQLQSYISGLERAKATAGIFADATSSAFSAVSQQLSGFLKTGNAVLDAFVGSLIQSLAQMASTLVANQIMKAILAQKDIGVQQGVSSANAVTIASSAAAALGPAGVIAFPGLLASQLGIVNGAFAAIRAIPAFATGGFSGDNNLIRVNGNETIFRPFELSAMYNALRGGNLGRLNPGVSNGIRDFEQVTEFVLRGQELSVLLKRVEKRR